MKKLTEIAAKFSLIAFVLLVAAALVVSGTGSSYRLLVTITDQSEQNDQVPDHHYLVPCSPFPQPAPENMAPCGQPFSRELAYIVPVVTAQFDNSSVRHKNSDCRINHLNNLSGGSKGDISLLTTLSQVSSQVGHQFTLVGSKPSGTS